MRGGGEFLLIRFLGDLEVVDDGDFRLALGLCFGDDLLVLLLAEREDIANARTTRFDGFLGFFVRPRSEDAVAVGMTQIFGNTSSCNRKSMDIVILRLLLLVVERLIIIFMLVTGISFTLFFILLLLLMYGSLHCDWKWCAMRKKFVGGQKKLMG